MLYTITTLVLNNIEPSLHRTCSFLLLHQLALTHPMYPFSVNSFRRPEVRTDKMISLSGGEPAARSQIKKTVLILSVLFQCYCLKRYIVYVIQ